MDNRIVTADHSGRMAGDRGDGPQPVGQILAELLAQYQARFPDARIEIVHTSAA